MTGQSLWEDRLFRVRAYSDRVPCLGRRFNFVVWVIRDGKIVLVAKEVLVAVTRRNDNQSLSAQVARNASTKLIKLARP